MGKEKEYHKYNAKPNIILDNKSAKLALFPVYFLATKNNQKDRISYAVINGQTGKIAADIPIDFKKFVFISTILSVIIFMLLNLCITFSMPKLIFLSIIFNIASIFILVKQNKKVKNREDEVDDLGVQFKKSFIDSNKTENKSDRGERNKKSNLTLIWLIIIPILFVNLILPIGMMILSIYPEMLKYIGYGVILIVSAVMIIRVMKHPEKDASFYKPIYGLLITLLVFCIKPALDIYYYVAGLTSIAFSIWSFYDIVTQFNLLTTRKLPQLGARGGDENA